MRWSVWYEAKPEGYLILVKQGIRVAGKETWTNDAGLSEALVRRLAQQKAQELARAKESLSQPSVEVIEGRGLGD